MEEGKTNTYLCYLLVLVFIITGTISLYRLSIKPGLPYELRSDLVDSVKILSLDNIPIDASFQEEFLTDRRSIGDTISITYKYAGSDKLYSSKVTLVRFYRNAWFISITAIIGYIFLLTGLFVLRYTTGNPHTRALFRVLVFFGIATLTSPGKYFTGFEPADYIIRTFHIAGYILGSISFIQFVSIFPVESSFSKKSLWKIIYYTGITLTILFSAHTVSSMIHVHNGIIYITNMLWRATETLLLVSMLSGIMLIIYKYKKLDNLKDRRQAEWIFWGLAFGVMPYIIFWIIPAILGINKPVIEELLLLFLIFVPLSFAVAVLKHQVFDISIIIKKSIVYSLLSGVIIAVFYLLSAVISLFIKSATGSSDYVFLTAALIIAFISNPLRLRLQKLVDKKFYRTAYDLQNTLTKFNAKIREAASVNELCDILRSEIDNAVHPECSGIALRTESGEKLKVLNSVNFKGIVPSIEVLKFDESIISNILKLDNIKSCLPITTGQDIVQGVVLLGEKMSGQRYTNDERMLFDALASSAAITLSKLKLQERVIEEEIELENLTKLNKIKSEFISGVTHELQTPLTSIKMLTETILDERVTSEEKKNNYLRIITSETDRLSRMINNVLDFSRIERNVKNYNFENADLIRITDYIINSLQFQIKRAGFNVNIKKESKSISIYADSDAVAEAIINIISNALKYSANAKKIDLNIYSNDDFGIIEIRDQGLGIPKDEQEFIFETYYRSKILKSNSAKGMGIGLSIVKHIMDSHNGKIILNSEPGKGTCFGLYFPKQKEEYQ